MSNSQEIGELARDFDVAFRGAKRVAWWAVAAALIAWFLSGLSSIEANQVGFVRRFGKVVRKDIEPGLTLLLPWPIDRLDTVPKKDIRRTEGGFSIQTARNHTTINPDAAEDIPYSFTGDQNIIHVSMVAEYQIKDPYQYLYKNISPDVMLISVLNDAIMTCTASLTIDEVLATKKELLLTETRQLAQKVLDELGTGLFLGGLQLETPPSVPEQTEAAFQSVIDAKVGMQTAKYRAQEFAKKLIGDAEGTAARIIAGAHAAKLAREQQATSDAQRFLAVLEQYEKDKAITRLRMYLDTMDEIMAKVRTYVLPAGQVAPGDRRALPPPLGRHSSNEKLEGYHAATSGSKDGTNNADRQ